MVHLFRKENSTNGTRTRRTPKPLNNNKIQVHRKAIISWKSFKISLKYFFLLNIFSSSVLLWHAHPTGDTVCKLAQEKQLM
mmetsp:Transcript_19769/g.23730  ORF Transcript_19769/g.23730 Transcript_19769/m.23730 type:complete len:81 (+) Transcript_19769:291-533(+)